MTHFEGGLNKQDAQTLNITDSLKIEVPLDHVMKDSGATPQVFNMDQKSKITRIELEGVKDLGGYAFEPDGTCKVKIFFTHP
jgi:hypothetical protein